MKSTNARRMPEYFRMLAGIFVAYVLIIGFGDSPTGGAARVGLLGFLLWFSARLHLNLALRRWALALGGIATISTAVLASVASTRLVYGVVGAWSTLLLAVTIGAIVSTLLVKGNIDASAVLGVLCIYLLLALLFAGVHQVSATFTQHYLNGASVPPDSSDLLYFSVITITTVGYGDLTPACLAARAVSVVEAMTGQLYLVSVVAGVVSGFTPTPRRTGPPDPPPGSTQS